MDELELLDANEKLTEQVATLETEKAQLGVELASALENATTLQGELDNTRTELSTAEASLTETKAELEALQESSKAVTEERDALKAEKVDFDKAVAEKVKTLGISTEAIGGDLQNDNESETVSREEFDAMSQQARHDFFKKGGRIAR